MVLFRTIPFVGKTGFEPATPWSQTRCATGLRYFPNIFPTRCPTDSGTTSRIFFQPGVPLTAGLLPEYFSNQVSR